jgi:prepilin-type N-terminal cleavage/methylation domain-containing protein
MRTISSRAGPSGMVLLELIIALTIFAIISLGLVTALDRAFSVNDDRNAANEVVRGMQNQLVLLKGQPLVPGERDLPSDGGFISYHVAVAPEPALDQSKQPVLGLYRATITASWKNEKSPETRSVSTLIYQP